MRMKSEVSPELHVTTDGALEGPEAVISYVSESDSKLTARMRRLNGWIPRNTINKSTNKRIGTVREKRISTENFDNLSNL